MNHAKNELIDYKQPEVPVLDRAKPGDIEICTGLIRTLFGIETEFTFDPGPVKRALGMMLDTPNAIILLARSGQEVIGMATGQLVISTACGAPSIWIEDVVVLDTHRGKGTGRMLIKGIEEWAALKAGARCQLLVDSENPGALGFYSRLGYRPSRMIPYRKMI